MAGATADVGAARVRPDVLGYPNPTTARYLIFATALLASGLFVGNFVHSWTMGDSWQRTIAVCEGRYGTGTSSTVGQAIDENRAFTRCTAGVERQRVAVTAAGAAVVGGAALALVWVAPVVVRRRRRLRALPDALRGAAERFEELATEAGVRGRVSPMLGPAGQRDAFSFGAPGDYRVALPPAVAVRYRDRSTFDPLVRHELAHVVHRDVALAWLTRLVWWALAPLLALPIVVGLVTGDRSILGSYAWRIALLAVAVALLSSELLRSREYGADLRAARLGMAVAPVVALVRRARSPATSLRTRVLAKHPSVDERVAVLEDPTALTRTGFLDGLTGGFLASLTVPLLVSAFSPLLAPVGRTDLAYVAAAVLLGPMLAGSVGLGLWRAALYRRIAGGVAGPVGVALGVGVGMVLGQAVSLQHAGTGSATGVSQPLWLGVSGVAGVGAVLVASGLAHLWADAAPRLPGVRAAWLLGLAMAALVFSALLWSTTLFQSAADIGGWVFTRQVLTSTLAPWWMVCLVLLLALAAAVPMALRPGPATPVPGWLVEDADRPWWPPTPRFRLGQTVTVGVAAGIAGTAVLVGFRLLVGPSGSDTETYERYLAYHWVAALTAGTAVLAAVTWRRHRGAGLALLAGPVAVAVVLGGFLLLNRALGGTASRVLVTEFLRPALVLGFYTSLLLAPLTAPLLRVAAAGGSTAVALEGGSAARPAGRRLPLVLAATLLVGGGLGAGALAQRETLVSGEVTVPTVDAREVDGSEGDAEASVGLVTEYTAYLEAVVPVLADRYGAVASTAARVWDDPTTDAVTKATLTRTQVLPPLTELLGEMEDYRIGDARLVAVHEEAVAALRAAVTAYRLLADSGGHLTSAVTAGFRELRAEEARHWQTWLDRRDALATELLGS